MSKPCLLIGAPIDSGKRRRGCLMGPDAMRVAGLAQALEGLGRQVRDLGNIAPAPRREIAHPNPIVHQLPETVAWTEALIATAQSWMPAGMPIFLGGDHAVSLGSIAGVAAHAAKIRRPLYVLWLDAHTDYHTPDTTTSGHLHGTPLGYVTGREGFEAFPPLAKPVPPQHICMLGLRSIDSIERAALAGLPFAGHDMRDIDENGIAAPLGAFLSRVAADNGLLHVSLDVDFLDPEIAPGVGTTVPGGATFREAHLVMEMLHESGLVTSLDVAELNPFLDERGRTAALMVDLVASLMGRNIFDRPTRSFAG